MNSINKDNIIHKVVKETAGGMTMALSNKNFLVILLISSLIVGCSGIERQTEKAMKAAEVAFRDDEKQPNQEAGLIQVHLPKDFKVVEEHDNNLILQKGDQIYILFVNPNEKEDSSVLYLAIKEQEDQFEMLHSFQTDDKFGFISIKEIPKEKYELAVGIGGVKLTTETDKDQLKTDAKQMMEIVSSVPQK
ncbi:hypothetical protein [Peribacillus frigoritolerans]|uniref:hypothetical protein n=2 Tax=Peribacillus frigoritolerans TaxID=450367 RepID=UPI002079ABF5|nr:hypothetical protein [Peribacillus frigoritolerans]USK63748.1 hypothetical protein LIT26_21430 [Peribacillus frigoritolerans]